MSEEKKNSEKTKELKKKLFLQRKLVWDNLNDGEMEQLMEFAEGYKTFLDKAKTEREATKEIVKYAKEQGFKSVCDDNPGDKVYYEYKNKCVAMAILGEQPLEDGVKIVVSHLDSPRIDLKQNPLYEDVDLGLLKTHYYGGIKKYHWVNRALALHGKIVKADGTELEISLGEDENDPIFVISDLLIHLWRKAQAKKKAPEVIEGEQLNILVGSIPYREDEDTDQRVKLALLQLLNEKYGIVEEDFVSAELEIVPAEKARDLGWDRSMIAAYGHDDRVCAYPSMCAIGEMETADKPVLVLFMDKEEIGSEGNTGAHSRFIENVVGELLKIKGIENESAIRKALTNSECISSDVNGGINPDWKKVHEEKNAAKLGYGICLTKFTGGGGKGGSNDAHAEFVGKLRKLFNENDIIWQTGELGKVDEGGGGTIAKFMAWYGMDVIDAGVPVLGMHSPYEVISKADLFMTYKAYKVFLEKE